MRVKDTEMGKVMISLGNAISVVTGMMYSRTGMSGIYRTIAAIVRLYDSDFTKEQIKMGVVDARNEVLRQHPWIETLALPGADDDAVAWLGIQEAEYGKFVQVSPIDNWAGHDVDVMTFMIPGVLSPHNRVSKMDLVIE
jgi:hypothetical protein